MRFLFLPTFRVPAWACLLLLAAANALQADFGAITSPVPGSNLTSSTVTFTWTPGAGRYFLYVGTTGQGSSNIFNSGFIANGTTSRVVSGVPTTSLVYVRLWCETGAGTSSYYTWDYTYNSDADSDGILDTIDPNPGVSDPMITVAGSDHTLTVLGSGRVATLESAALFSSTNTDMNSTEARSVAQRVYEHFKDDFDFIIAASNQASVPSESYFGRFYNAQNTVAGIGKSIFDSTSQFGSAGRLQGVIHLTSTNGLSGGPSLHEIAHNWGNSMSSVPTVVGGHWGYSNIGGQLGGWQPNSLESLGGNQYRVRNPRSGQFGSFGGNANGGNGLTYSNFELYTMGLITANEVGHDVKIANSFAWVDPANGIFQASSITTNTMAEVVSTDGARLPDPGSSQKNFRVLYLLITSTPLTLGEWAEFDQDVYRFDLDGDDGTGSYNFWEATGGRATLTMNAIAGSLLIMGDPVYTPIERLTVTTATPAVAEIDVMTSLGSTYTLEYSTGLPANGSMPGWIDGESLAGSGGILTLRKEVGTAPTKFFQVRED
jgi:hypothetical protein